MLFENKYLLLHLLSSQLIFLLKSKWKNMIGILSILLLFLVFFDIYHYYNRLELISKYEYNGEIFELYQDWSKSTQYFMKLNDRYDADNYYVIKKNNRVYFKFKHNYPFAVSYQYFSFYGIERDSLVLLEKAIDDYHGCIYLKLPLSKEAITRKEIRIIPIFPEILKNGRKISAKERINYLIDDFKKVPVEVINYENIISDY